MKNKWHEDAIDFCFAIFFTIGLAVTLNKALTWLTT